MKKKKSKWSWKEFFKVHPIVFWIGGLLFYISALLVQNEAFMKPAEGRYFHNTKILVYTEKEDSIAHIQRVYQHELGHHIWYSVMNDTERDNYKYVYEHQNDTDWTVEEDFAEWFSIYTDGMSGEWERNMVFQDVIQKYGLDIWWSSNGCFANMRFRRILDELERTGG